MKVSYLRYPLLMGCLLLSLAGQGVCEDRRRVMMLPAIHFPPYMVTDKGKYNGIVIDIQRLIAEKLNWTVDFFDCPSLARCHFLAEEGKLGIYVEMTLDNKGYRDYLYYLQPSIEAITSKYVFYIQKKGAVNIRSYDDLSGLTVGTVIGGIYFEPFNSDPSIHKFEVPDWMQLYKMLETGRIDAYLGLEDLNDVYLNSSRFKGLFKKADYRAETIRSVHIVLPKKSSFTKDRFKIEEVLRQLVESGKVREIYKRYGIELPSPTQQAPK